MEPQENTISNSLDLCEPRSVTKLPRGPLQIFARLGASLTKKPKPKTFDPDSIKTEPVDSASINTSIDPKAFKTKDAAHTKSDHTVTAARGRGRRCGW